MSPLHPTRLVRLTLLGTLLGVSFPFAAESLVHDYSTPRLLAGIGFAINAMNFFHGKVVSTEDEEYNVLLVSRPIYALCDFVLNILVALTFVFMAFFLGMPTQLIVASIVLRSIDLILTGFVVHMDSEWNGLNIARLLGDLFGLRGTGTHEASAVRRAQRTWAYIDLAGIAWFTLVGLWLFDPPAQHGIEVACSFLGFVILDVLVDYSLNREMYFSTAVSWEDEELACLWDNWQGEHGDVYRRSILIPGILRQIGVVEGKRVLDVGCGNGCVARALSSEGADVVAIDKSPAMIEIAKQWGDGVTYRVCDVENVESNLDTERFDVVVALFSLQDCHSLEQPFQFIAKHLQQNGKAIVIVENDAAFESNRHATTRRRWLDSVKLLGRGRRQLIVWQPELIHVDKDNLLDLHGHRLTRGFGTVTRHWSIARYVVAARKAGLQPTLFEREMKIAVRAAIEGDGRTLLRGYEQKPKFQMRVFAHKETSSPVIPPIMVLGGPSGVGKSVVAERLSSSVIPVDAFYRDVDDPKVPRRGEALDWESLESVRVEDVEAAINSALHERRSLVPIYDMRTSKATGEREVTIDENDVIVVEGLFAFEIDLPGGCDVIRVFLSASPLRVFLRRVKRDLQEGRRRLLPAVLHGIRLASSDYAYARANYSKADFIISCHKPPDRIVADIRVQTGLWAMDP